jgi:hypothetical protein
MKTPITKMTPQEVRAAYQRAQAEVTRLDTRLGETQAALTEAVRERQEVLRDVANGGDKARLTKLRPRIAELEELIAGIGILVDEAEVKAAEARKPVLELERAEHEVAVARQTTKVETAWDRVVKDYIATAGSRAVLVLELAALATLDKSAEGRVRSTLAAKRKFTEEAAAAAVTVNPGFQTDAFEFFLPPLAPPVGGIGAGSDCPAQTYLAAQAAAAPARGAGEN